MYKRGPILLFLVMFGLLIGLAVSKFYFSNPVKTVTTEEIYHRAQARYGKFRTICRDIIVNREEFNLFFKHITNTKEVDYIVRNYRKDPNRYDLRSNDHRVLMAVVEMENKDVKIIIYNAEMKRTAKISKMFVLTDYFLSYSLDRVIEEMEKNSPLRAEDIFFKENGEYILDLHVTWTYDMGNDTLFYYMKRKHQKDSLVFSIFQSDKYEVVVSSFKLYIGRKDTQEIIYPYHEKYGE